MVVLSFIFTFCSITKHRNTFDERDQLYRQPSALPSWLGGMLTGPVVFVVLFRRA